MSTSRVAVIYRKCNNCSEIIKTRDFSQKFALCDACIVLRDFIPRYKRLCDEDPEPPEWPSDKARYVDSSRCPESSKLHMWQRYREFVIGTGCFHTAGYLDQDRIERDCPRMDGVKCDMDLSELFPEGLQEPAGPDPSSTTFHTKVLLFTEMVDQISVYPSEVRGSCGKEGIQGVTIVRGNQVIDTGCLKKEAQLTLSLDEENPFIKRITIQHTIWRVPNDEQCLKKRITHLVLEPFKGEPLCYGKLQEAGECDDELVCPAETEEGAMIIVGIGFAHALPLSFQVVDLLTPDQPTDELLTMFCCRDIISCVNVSANLELYEHCRMPALEDPEVYSLADDLLAGIENASPSDAELLPNAIKFVDKTQRGDLQTMMSIFRMDRYITHIIQTRGQIKTWTYRQNHWRKFLSLKQMMSIVSNITLFSRKLIHHKPELNVYTYGVLASTRWDTVKAYLTFMTQTMLMVFCVCGMDLSNFCENTLFVCVTVCVTAVVSFMVREQIGNHFSAVETFSHAKKSPLLILDAIANILMPLLVLGVTFALLACSEEYLDMVMNSTAVLCILEMDSAMLSADEEQIKDQCCASAYKFLQDTIRGKDERYWIHAALANDRPCINVEHCALVWDEKE